MIHYTKRVCTVSAFDIDGNQNIMLTIFGKNVVFLQLFFNVSRVQYYRSSSLKLA